MRTKRQITTARPIYSTDFFGAKGITVEGAEGVERTCEAAGGVRTRTGWFIPVDGTTVDSRWTATKIAYRVSRKGARCAIVGQQKKDAESRDFPLHPDAPSV